MSTPRNLRLEVILQAVDRLTRPFRSAMGSSTALARTVRATREQLRELNRTQAGIDSFRKLSRDAAITQNQLRGAQASVKALSDQMAATERPTAAMSRGLQTAVREAQALKRRGTELQQNLHGVRGRLEAAGISTTSLGQAQRDLRARVTTANEALAQQEARLRAVGARQRQMAAAQAQYAKGMAVRNSMLGAGVSTMAAGGVAMAPIAKAVKDYVTFEDAMLGIARQVDGARDDAGNLTAVYYDMARQIKLLGEELPIPTAAIAEMVTAGARMEVPREELIAYTRTVAMMATAFDAVPDEIAESMGKVAKNFRIPTAGIQALADSINYLDDNAISKGSDIINVLNRISGVVSTVKMSSSDAAALASTLLTLGERTETAGTAINAITQRFAAAEKGTKRFQSAAAEIGLTTQEIQKGMSEDATGTIFKVVEAVRRLPKDKRIGVMVELVGMEHSDTLAKLVDKPEEFQRQLELANGAKAKGSMEREFSARQQTISAAWARLQNKLFNTSADGGEVLRPVLVSLMESIGNLVDRFNAFAKANPTVVAWLIKGTAAAAALLAVTGALALALAATFGPFVIARFGLQMLGMRLGWLIPRFPRAAASVNLLSTAVGRLGAIGARLAPTLGTASRILSGLVSGVTSRLGALFNVARGLALMPFSWPILATIAALVAAATLVYKYWAPIKGFFIGLGSGIASAMGPVVSALADAFVRGVTAAKNLAVAIGSAAMSIPGMSDALIWMWQYVGPMLSTFWNWLTRLIDPVEDIGGAAQSMGEKVGKAIGTVLALPLKLTSAFYNAGAWLMEGFANGINGGLAKIKDAVGNAADKATSYFKEKLGIRSPSRVFAELGGFTMAGLEKGLLGGQDGPLQAVSRIAREVVSAGAGSLHGEGVLGTVTRITQTLAGIGAGVAVAAAPAAANVPIDTRPPIAASAQRAPAPATPPAPIIINIHPPAGADERLIARLVEDKLRQIESQRAARQRSRLTDRD